MAACPASSHSLSPVIVTGGCGFIGSHIVSEILKLEPSAVVHVLDISQSNQMPGVAYHTYRLGICIQIKNETTYHTCDISSISEVEAVFRKSKAKTVFHVASPDPTKIRPALYRKVNVIGTRNLLTAAKSIGTVRAFIYTSSSSVIHDNHSDLVNGDESWPILRHPVQKWSYTLSKAEAEEDILASNRCDGDSSMLTASIRPASVFGERDCTTFAKIATNARKGKAHLQIGPGQNLFDVTYISNLVNAQLLAAQGLLEAHGKPPGTLEMRIDGEAFFITNDEHMLFWDYQRAIAASVGSPVKKQDIKIVPTWVAYLTALVAEWYTWAVTWGQKVPIVTREAVRMTVIHRTFNIEKAKRVLGYRPKVTIEEGLARAGK